MTVRIIPVSEMRQQLRKVLDSLEETGEPYFITQYSSPRAVLMRFEDYNALMEQQEKGRSCITSRPDISGGEPIIQGTRITVRHLVERFQSGQGIDEIKAALPHLKLAQIYAALSYYFDHQEELDPLIEACRPEKAIAAQGLKLETVGAGIAVVVDRDE